MAYARHPHRNIVLTGFYGAGKTLVGRELSRRLRRPFVDVDQESRRRVRAPLRVLLPFSAALDVEESERRIIGDLAYRRESVIALGPEPQHLRDCLAELEDFAMVVLLDPPFETLWSRIAANPAYSSVVEQHGRMGMHGLWSDLKREMDNCDLLLADDDLSIQRAVQLITHCFYT